MAVSQALATPVGEIMESSVLVPRNGFPLEPRCRVCRNDVLRKKVNDMLASGASYAMVSRALAEDNAAASITKSARETPSVHHVGMPAKR